MKRSTAALLLALSFVAILATALLTAGALSWLGVL